MDLATLRSEYAQQGLHETSADPDPLRQFRHWLQQALAANLPEPTAMTLATCTPDGRPSARIVLLKGLSDDGFSFYTSYEGRKARDLAANPRAALLFYWAELERQARVEGTVERVDPTDSDAYFATRPRGSQLGAWASHQSEVIPGRDVLEARLADLEARFAGREVSRPPNWGGYRVRPEVIEFWQGRPNRLHDRLRYHHEGAAWVMERLSP